MSEVASYTTTIKIPSLAQRTTLSSNLLDQEPRAALLKRSLELLVEDHGGRITSQIEDCDGKRIPCLMGVRTQDFPNGLGVVARPDGTISFVYDAYGDNQGIGRRLAGEISANYNAIAVQMALRDLNMQVKVNEARTRGGQRVIQVEGKV